MLKVYYRFLPDLEQVQVKALVHFRHLRQQEADYPPIIGAVVEEVAGDILQFIRGPTGSPRTRATPCMVAYAMKDFWLFEKKRDLSGQTLKKS